MLSYSLFIFNSKNIEKEKKRYRKLVNWGKMLSV
jgi:hypothetical protein